MQPLPADEIAESAEFFSFGTNDLTQMTCGFSRDDAASFLGPYVNDTDKELLRVRPVRYDRYRRRGQIGQHGLRTRALGEPQDQTWYLW